MLPGTPPDPASRNASRRLQSAGTLKIEMVSPGPGSGGGTEADRGLVVALACSASMRLLKGFELRVFGFGFWVFGFGFLVLCFGFWVFEVLGCLGLRCFHILLCCCAPT